MCWTTTAFKLFNANDTELLKGHNVYTVLSRMSYLHGSSFAEAKERLDPHRLLLFQRRAGWD